MNQIYLQILMNRSLFLWYPVVILCLNQRSIIDEKIESEGEYNLGVRERLKDKCYEITRDILIAALVQDGECPAVAWAETNCF